MEKEKIQTNVETSAENQVNNIIGNSATTNTQEVNSVVIDETQQNEQSNFAEVSKTRVCSKCGEELQESQLFCPKCGKKYQESKGSKKKVVIISSMVVVILVIAIIAVILIFPKDIQVSKIAFDKTNLNMNVGDSELLIIKVTPENATDKSVVWTSSDNNIVSIVNGKITGVKEGTAIITAKSTNGITAVCTVAVEEKLPDLKAIYDSLNDDYYCKVASDGSYLSIDTNPLDIDDYSSTYAYEFISKVNENLGLPESILERMNHTRALDGTQSQTYGKINVSWTYHPNQGLQVTYEVIK